MVESRVEVSHHGEMVFGLPGILRLVDHVVSLPQRI
jgi:hypothetical protein